MKIELSQEMKTALIAAAKIHGRKAKSAIRQAWFDGNYHAVCLAEHDSPLQRLRNTYGPTGLQKISISKLIAEAEA
ncbi:MAG: hypothetical protein AAFX93_19405 [Verrucomicrobiota bacterium]